MNTHHMPIPSNRVRDIKSYFHSLLDVQYSHDEVSAFLARLFEAFLGWDTVQLLLNADSTVNQSDLLKFYWASVDLQRYRPVQHIVGYTYFLNNKISVTSDTLIPRPETEEIVSRVIDVFAASYSFAGVVPLFLDVCTGSGCIAVALAKAFPQAKVHAVDISDKALQVAHVNAVKNNVDVCFFQYDVLSSSFSLAPSSYHLIVCNPPYVCYEEQRDMSRNVLDYEPHQALFVPDDDPLLFYRAVALHAAKALVPDGLLVFEVSQYHALSTERLLQAMGFATALYADYKGACRMLVASMGAALPQF